MSDAAPTSTVNETLSAVNADTYLAALDQRKVSMVLWKYVLPVQIVLGTCGNLLSALIMARPKLRHSVTALLLQALAAADTLVLLVVGIISVLREAYNEDIGLTTVGCPVITFLMYFSFMVASWILTCVSLERFIVVIFPHKAKKFVTKRRAIITIGTMVASVALLNGHLLWTVRLQVTPDGPYCGGKTKGIDDFMKNAWRLVDMVMYVILPSLLIFISNISIICRLTMIRLRQQHTVAPNMHVSQLTQTKFGSMTLVLVTISCVFLVTTLPVEIYLLVESPWNTAGKTPDQTAYVSMVWAFLVELAFVNHSTNFVWYCLISPVFGREFFAVFPKWCKRSVGVVENGNSPADT